MILGVGIDLVSVSRIEGLIQEFGDKFLKKIFTGNEILKANQIKVEPDNLLPQALFYAKRFSAKEAFSKALGLGLGRGINFSDIEVENDEFGKPMIKILNEKSEFVRKYFGCKNFVVHLSLSDENPIATAIVIIEKIS